MLYILLKDPTVLSKLWMLFFLQANEATFETQVMMKRGFYKLMELLYSRLPKDELYSKDSQINQAFCGETKSEGNELSKNLLK